MAVLELPVPAEETFHDKYLRAKQAFFEGGVPQSGSVFGQMPLTPEGVAANTSVTRQIAAGLLEGLAGGEPGSTRQGLNWMASWPAMIIGPQNIAPDSLTSGQWGRVSRKVKAAGYDVRGGQDVKEIYQRLSAKNALPTEYTQAIDSVVGGLPYALDEGGIALEKAAIKEFGVTSNPRGGGYIMRNGRMLDFSGGDPYSRGIDHRAIGVIFPWEAKNRYEYISAFGRETGSIRMHWSPQGSEDYFDIFSRPTKQQTQAMRNMITNVRDFKVEFNTPNGDVVSTISGRGMRDFKKVEKEIDRLFSSGKYYVERK